jgi:hypothetical protein
MAVIPDDILGDQVKTVISDILISTIRFASLGKMGFQIKRLLKSLVV